MQIQIKNKKSFALGIVMGGLLGAYLGSKITKDFNGRVKYALIGAAAWGLSFVMIANTTEEIKKLNEKK